MKFPNLITHRIRKMVGSASPTVFQSAYQVTAAEIENLREEAQALKRIRQSMGSDDFSRNIFEKVFNDDINRLRSMQDMWKTRQPPTALDFDVVSKSSASGGEVGESVAKRDQVTWTLAENFTVFCDRSVILA